MTNYEMSEKIEIDNIEIEKVEEYKIPWTNYCNRRQNNVRITTKNISRMVSTCFKKI